MMRQAQSSLFLVTICALLLSGCSDPEHSWESNDYTDDQGNYYTDNHIREPIDYWGRFTASLDSVKAMVGLTDEAAAGADPALVNILQGNASAEDWQNIDKNALKEKARELKDVAESMGFSADQELTDEQRGWVRSLGSTFGLSTERLDELEDKYDQNKHKISDYSDKL